MPNDVSGTSSLQPGRQSRVRRRTGTSTVRDALSFFAAGTAVGRPESRPLVSGIGYICSLVHLSHRKVPADRPSNRSRSTLFAPQRVAAKSLTVFSRGADSVLRHWGRTAPTEDRYAHGRCTQGPRAFGALYRGCDAGPRQQESSTFQSLPHSASGKCKSVANSHPKSNTLRG